jgi:hypothetical protein
MKNKVKNQHGDVVWEVVDKIPAGAKEISISAPEGYVFERGEGVHVHTFQDMGGVRVYEIEGKIYVKVERNVVQQHEEHGCQVLTPGIYRKRVERVFDYAEMESRAVRD